MIRSVLFGVILCFTFLGCNAMAVEEPAFKTILHEGDFEIRDYPALIVAEVTVTGGQKEAASKGFRLLANYNFGGNKQSQKIAMTAPVVQERAGEKIPMTAPVTQTEKAGAWVVRFIMPPGSSLDTLPVPNDPQVQLRALSPARVAVVRFSGLAREDDVAAKTAELMNLVKAHHLNSIEVPSLAQYNPPWTLWFLRRNEVMVPVDQ
jgi:DNA gyrase inhibitor GyrI